MTVTKIPAKSQLPINVMTAAALRRVAGYARVSTNEEEQLTSYAAQVEYYTQLIQANPAWQFVNVYTDEGISATSTKRRGGFNQMVEDALAGKIDLIITKSISRFARNTVDSLVTIRALKEAGVEVWFEKENIQTFDSKGELLITIMSSLAQEESRSISENGLGASAAPSRRAGFPCPTNSFSATKKAKMATRKSWKKKPKLCG